MTARAELSSINSSLDELAQRVSQLAEGLTGRDRDLIGPELFEVERSLRSAKRNLSRLIEKARP